MQHSFDVSIAMEYGIEEAIIISNFQFWLNKNYADGVNQHDGRTWTYNTNTGLAKLFPYLSTRSVRYAIDGLVAKGILIKGNYNKQLYDRTNWYAFGDEKQWLYTVSTDIAHGTKLSNGVDKIDHSHLTKLANGSDEIVQPIPDSKQDNKQDVTTDILHEEDDPKPVEVKINKKGSRLDINWRPTDEGIQYCLTKRPDIDVEDTILDFVEYWCAKAGKDALKTNWNLTWQSWVRKSYPKFKPGVQNYAGNRKLSLSEEARASYERVKAREDAAINMQSSIISDGDRAFFDGDFI